MEFDKESVLKIGGVFLAILVIGFIAMLLSSSSSPEDYLGQWRSELAFNDSARGGHKKAHVITLSVWEPAPGKGPKWEYKLKSGQTAYLKIPIVMTSTLNLRKERGGIYHISGYGHAMIAWSYHYGTDTINLMKIEWGELKLGHRKDGDNAMKIPPHYWQTLEPVN